MRLSGARPWEPIRAHPTVVPGGSLYQAHPLLGYTNIPGKFSITLPSGYRFTATHDADRRRITAPVGSANTGGGSGEIWIFGCSFTYGWSLNDAETYPWLLQERFRQKQIINFAVSGYGTVNSSLQFQDALEKTARPELVVLTYGTFHDERNTVLRKWAKATVPYTERAELRVRPRARLGESQELVIEVSSTGYRELPFMRRSAFVHAVEESYNRLEEKYSSSNDVSKRVIESFHDLATGEGIEFVVAGLNNGARKMLDYLDEKGIATVDISVDLSQPGYRNLPHDDHPSHVANQEYAAKLGLFLEGMSQ